MARFDDGIIAHVKDAATPASPPAAIDAIRTPALLLDLARLDANIARGAARAQAQGFKLRPHLKTAKCVEVARRLFNGGTGPITVSTLAEVEFFHSHGFSDILYAVPTTALKLERLVPALERGLRLRVLTDTLEGARGLAAFGKVPVFLEVDVDGHRGGLAPDNPDLLAAAQVLAKANLFGGLLAHAGGSYDGRSDVEAARHSEMECDEMRRAAARLRDAGVTVPCLSVGSTPTMLYGENYKGIDEVRAGVYVFMDLVMVGVGICRVEDIAISVLATVIGHQAGRDQLFVDAGWQALSRDRGTQSHPVDQGYGLVLDEAGKPLSDLIVKTAYQEHGVVASRAGGKLDVTRFPVGTRLRILPNHACATAGQHDRYHVVDGPSVIGHWARVHGW